MSTPDATPFEMTPGWLCFHPDPSVPAFRVPPGTVDAHCHVFGPGAEFPFAPERKYTPCDASKAELFALRDHLGFARNVIVQATCHGADNRAMADACRASGGKARGVATVKRSVTDAELQDLHAAGVRGVRFNFVRRLVDFTPREVLAEIAARIAPLGWHVVVYFEAQDLPDLWDFFTALPTTVVVDHLGRPDVTLPVEGPQFARFERLLREAMFTPTDWGSALYMPPFERQLLMRWAMGFERIGARISSRLGGLIIVEAQKELLAPVGTAKHSRVRLGGILPVPVGSRAPRTHSRQRFASEELNE